MFPIFIREQTLLAPVLWKTSLFSVSILFVFLFFPRIKGLNKLHWNKSKSSMGHGVITGSWSHKGSNFGSNLQSVCTPIAPLNPIEWWQLCACWRPELFYGHILACYWVYSTHRALNPTARVGVEETFQSYEASLWIIFSQSLVTLRSGPLVTKW